MAGELILIPVWSGRNSIADVVLLLFTAWPGSIKSHTCVFFLELIGLLARVILKTYFIVWSTKNFCRAGIGSFFSELVNDGSCGNAGCFLRFHKMRKMIFEFFVHFFFIKLPKVIYCSKKNTDRANYTRSAK